MTVYYDMCESNGYALIFPREIEVVPAGTTLYAMSRRNMNAEYQRYADIYDLKFIFDDDIPQISFFTVPYVDVFARDSTGGLFGTIGETTGISAVKDFLQMLESGRDWRTTMISNHDISFFQSRADAEQSFEFVDIRRDSPYID